MTKLTELRPYQVKTIRDALAACGITTQAELYKATTGRELTVSPAPQPRSAIMTITTDELDHLLAPYIRFGLLRTSYERITRATEYRGPSGELIAMTVGTRHFCRRISGPMRSIALYMQHVGRLERQGARLVAYLEDRRTGQKIEGSEFTVGGAQ